MTVKITKNDIDVSLENIEKLKAEIEENSAFRKSIEEFTKNLKKLSEYKYEPSERDLEALKALKAFNEDPRPGQRQVAAIVAKLHEINKRR